MTVKVGALHLGWDVVSVAAGGGGTPIRPVQVEGTFTPAAYLLADKQGRLHTPGTEKQRPDLGMAVADVRDILGHRQIVIAGATWPAENVFQARLYAPLAAVGQHLQARPELVALPFPDSWPDERVELLADLVEKLGVIAEPLPESVALSGYLRALGAVRAPDYRNPNGQGATAVYSDGRTMLVVAVHGDDEQPTESVEVAVSGDAMRSARGADDVVIEVMAAARSIGADTSKVLLAGNVCFNDALRLAFQNHLGQRLQVADHPMHALVLGACHLLVTEAEAAADEHMQAGQPDPAAFVSGPPHTGTGPSGAAVGRTVPPGTQGPQQPAQGGQPPQQRPPQQPGQRPGPGTAGPRHALPDSGAEGVAATTKMARDRQ